MSDARVDDPPVVLSDNSTRKKIYYKYRPLYQHGACGIREPHPFTKSIFEKAEFFYSAPKDFNDPFDCNLKLHVDDSTDAEWEEYFDQLIEQHPGKMGNLKNLKAQKIWATNPKFKDSVGVDTHKAHYEESSVFCLSKKVDSIPMFSYYADNHCGIAMEFQFSRTEIPCGIPFGDLADRANWYQRKIVVGDVKYPTSYPELNYHRLYGRADQLIQNIIFTKHHEWSHEEEFRIFRRRVPAAAVAFDRSLLTRVIFGCKAGQDEVDLVKSWLVGWPSDVILAKAETANARFELKINDFDIVKASVNSRTGNKFSRLISRLHLLICSLLTRLCKLFRRTK